MGGCKCLLSLVVVLALTMSLAEAQSGTTGTCAQELIPCMDYLNSTGTPPSSCCDPLKRTVENELACLCNLFYTPGLLENFNISIDSALGLSRRCGVTSDLTKCNAPAPASRAPPATPGSGESGAGKATFTGISFLLLFWVSMLFN
ncbi:non-specific lipid transfer protein GPI-anchored 7-like [Vigna umbellata]|uniref:non-specific lipid transfer protein GPI-anchored 7-like n=1 Tax=Vigna umbellata TaxID=87088 RepID=UPI001F5EBB7C|nr:non-specific lipid transfer protein GPI-anchored 7-like [Vigna umbellata]